MAMVSNPKGSPSSSSKEYRYSVCGRIFDSAETLSSHKSMDHGQEGSHTPVGVD
jgi:hypothetical protein